MTREETKKNLVELHMHLQTSPAFSARDYRTAVKLAIEALEQVEELQAEIDVLNWVIGKLSQERPKGRWKLIQEDWNTYECTECKEWWTLESGTPLDNNMAYCPFCGASMGESEQE